MSFELIEVFPRKVAKWNLFFYLRKGLPQLWLPHPKNKLRHLPFLFPYDSAPKTMSIPNAANLSD